MFEPFAPAIDAFAKRLARNYRAVFGKGEPDHAHLLRATAKLALERISRHRCPLPRRAPHPRSSPTSAKPSCAGAPWSSRCPGSAGSTSPSPPCCTTSATCAGSAPATATGATSSIAAGNTVAAPRGATDAFLAPWHVERAKIFVRRRCAAVPGLDLERLCRAIELTRFPVPEDGDHAETETEAGLVRAADLVGQLADPAYPRKLAALFHEFRETGAGGAARLP